jgi:hypothetical protein
MGQWINHCALVVGSLRFEREQWVKGTRRGGLCVEFRRDGSGGLVEAGDLALIEGVAGEFLGETDEDGFALLDSAIAELSDC